MGFDPYELDAAMAEQDRRDDYVPVCSHYRCTHLAVDRVSGKCGLHRGMDLADMRGGRREDSAVPRKPFRLRGLDG